MSTGNWYRRWRPWDKARWSRERLTSFFKECLLFEASLSSIELPGLKARKLHAGGDV
jgi:hypothetical protein